MSQAQARLIKRSFKTPEGRFSLCTDRPLSCHFNAVRAPKLSLVTLTVGMDAGTYMIFNIMDSLHICPLAETNKVIRSPTFLLMDNSGLANVRHEHGLRMLLLHSSKLADYGPCALQQALRAIAFGMMPAGTMIFPTCHDSTQVSPRDGYDLLIGLSTGDGETLS